MHFAAFYACRAVHVFNVVYAQVRVFVEVAGRLVVLDTRADFLFEKEVGAENVLLLDSAVEACHCALGVGYFSWDPDVLVSFGLASFSQGSLLVVLVEGRLVLVDRRVCISSSRWLVFAVDVGVLVFVN